MKSKFFDLGLLCGFVVTLTSFIFSAVFCSLDGSSSVGGCVLLFSYFLIYFEFIVAFLLCFLLLTLRMRKESGVSFFSNLFVCIVVVLGIHGLFNILILNNFIF